MAKKMCDLCQQAVAKDMRFGVNLCESCLDGYHKAMDGDLAFVARFSNAQNFPNATNLAKIRIIDSIAQKHQREIAAQKAIQQREDIEQRHQNFAKSFHEFYEYDVVTIINENHGQVDKVKMLQVLSEYAQRGWKLHTMYSNELGKNAITLLGLNVNSTACEDVLIFERRIEQL